MNVGFYTDRGLSSVREQHRDFARIGGRIGISVVSDDPAVPLEFRSTYIGLYDTRGGRNVGYFANELNWALDARRYFLFGFSYSNGTREDTTKREQLWLLGLKVRY